MKYGFSPSSKKVIFFDLNNTLIDVEKTFDACFLAVADDFTGRWETGPIGKPSPEELLKTFRQEWKNARKPNRGKYGTSPDFMRLECLKKTLRSANIPADDQFSSLFLEQIRKRRAEHAVWFPDVKETLEELAQKGYRLAIISNGKREMMDTALKKAKLAALFPDEHRFTSGDRGAGRKPGTQIFQYALSRMSVDPIRTVMVGNSWRNDIDGAARAGIDSVWINPNEQKTVSRRTIGKQKVMVVCKFSQLRQLF